MRGLGTHGHANVGRGRERGDISPQSIPRSQLVRPPLPKPRAWNALHCTLAPAAPETPRWPLGYSGELEALYGEDLH
jgi:hypothetical protein